MRDVESPAHSSGFRRWRRARPHFSYRELAAKLEQMEKRYFGRGFALPAGTAMDQGAVSAASGLRSRMQALDLLANNLANANTAGFKLDREFYSLFTGDAELSAMGDTPVAQLPQVKSHWTDFAQGTLTPTGNPLDVALDGP